MILFIIMLSFNSITYALSVSDGDAAVNPGNYKPEKGDGEEALSEKTGVILGIINVIGVLTSVITLICLGIRYMFGSVEEKADYKKTFGMYLIGAFLVFSITTIPNILYQMSSSSLQ